MKNAPVISRFALLAALLAGAAACTPTVDMRGNQPHPDVLAQIVPGKTTRDDVTVLLGTPSTVLTYGEETWHYISSKTERVAFFEPKTIERNVVTVRFDAGGKVAKVEQMGLESGKDIQLVDRETPTAGKEMSILEQLLGNVGRFSKPAAGSE